MDYRKLYDALYDVGYHSNPNAMSKLVDVVIDKLQFDSVLDIGCSQGASVAKFASLGKVSAGIEVSSIAVERAKAFGRNVIQGSATMLPFEDQSFDLVMSGDVFEHLLPEDIEVACAEAIRVSKRYIAMRICTWIEVNRAPLKRAKKKYGLDVENLHLSVFTLNQWIGCFNRVGRKIGCPVRLIARYDQLTFFLEKRQHRKIRQPKIL